MLNLPLIFKIHKNAILRKLFVYFFSQIHILEHIWEPSVHFWVKLYQNLNLALISSKLKKIQTSRLLHFKDQIKNILVLPKFVTNSFFDQNQNNLKKPFFQNFIGCPTVQFLNCNVLNHRVGSLLIYFLPQKVLKTSLAFFLLL